LNTTALSNPIVFESNRYSLSAVATVITVSSYYLCLRIPYLRLTSGSGIFHIFASISERAESDKKRRECHTEVKSHSQTHSSFL